MRSLGRSDSVVFLPSLELYILSLEWCDSPGGSTFHFVWPKPKQIVEFVDYLNVFPDSDRKDLYIIYRDAPDVRSRFHHLPDLDTDVN